jgi:hypothetical protein
LLQEILSRIIKITMNLQNAIVVFVARAEPARLMTQHAKRDWLLKSLEPVKEFRETILPGLVETFVFILQSNSPFRPAGEVILYFTDLFKEAQQQDRDILLVVRGWDGLTTNQGAFQKLFALRPESVLGLLVCGFYLWILIIGRKQFLLLIYMTRIPNRYAPSGREALTRRIQRSIQTPN